MSPPPPPSCLLRAVGNKENDPFTKFTKFCWDADCPSPGNSVDFLKMTLQLINCSLQVVHIDASADDSIELIANGTADISLLALRQTRKRMELADFTQPVNFLYYGYLVMEVPQLKVEDYILASFQVNALALLVIAGIIVGCLVYFYTYLFHYKEGSLFHWMTLCLTALLRQFSCHLAGPIAAHILVGFWLYFCMLIVSNYEAKLKSFLTLSHPRGTLFTDLDGLIDAVMHSGYSIVIQDGGYTPMLYCKPEQCARLEKLPKDRVIRLPQGPDIFHAIDTPKKVGFVALTNDINPYAMALADVKRRLLFVRDSVAGPDLLAYAVAKNNSWLREHFNKAVTITNPSYPTVRGRYAREMTPYDGTATVRREITVLRFSHLAALFNTSAELIALSTLCLVLEMIIYHHGSNTYRFVRSWCPCFRHKLHINRSLGMDEFPRRQIIVLPPHRSASPPPKAFEKFQLTPSGTWTDNDNGSIIQNKEAF